MKRLASAFFQRLLGRLIASERGLHRYRMAGLAVSANLLSKALSFAVILFSTRVVLEHLGVERFGIYATISSVAVLFSFMDLGLSNALVSRVANLYATPSPDSQSTKIITTGILGLSIGGVIAAVLLVTCFMLMPLEPWFKGAGPESIKEARAAGCAFAVCFGLSLPAQGLYRIYAGLQRGWIAHVVAAAGSVFSLLLVAVCPKFDASMAIYLLATFGIQQLVPLTLFKDLARRGILDPSRLSLSALRAIRSDTLFAQGRLFLLIQIGVTVVWGSNQIILSSVVGPAETAAFSVAQRMFMVVAMPLAILNAPLWAMYADAHAHVESEFIRGTLKRSMALTMSLAIGGVLLVMLASPLLINLLSNGEVTLPYAAIALFAAWTFLEATGTAFAMFLNGVGVIRPQAITAFAYALVSVPLKVAGARYFGITGLLLIMVLSYTLFTALPLLTVFRREWLKPMERNLPNSNPAA